MIQPSEDTYNFTELDEVIAMLSQENYDIVLATSTAKRHGMDGKALSGGRKGLIMREDITNSDSVIMLARIPFVFQKFASRLAGKLAERYGNNPHVTC